MTAEEIRAWQAIFRDFVITLVATAICLYSVIVISPPSAVGIGGAVSLYALPPVLRLDVWRRRRRNGNGNGNGDPYDGPGGYYRE